MKQLGSNNKLVITTIQKLTNAVKKDRHSSVIERVRNKRMVFIYDECHRFQFGDMHKLIVGYFTNHQSFGFTGTPIMAENANKGRTTKDLFGDCLHQYVIKDAIDDDFARYGRLAPRTKADFAFVQHMLHQLDDNGTMAVVLPHGVLFRGAAEGVVREYLIKEMNWLDAVMAELKSIETEIGDVDKRIMEQCKELGIAAPVFTGIN